MENKAVLNFANMNNEAVTMFSTCQLAINDLASAENALTFANKQYADLSKEERKEATKEERKEKQASKERATNLCIACITRYVSTEDYLNGEIYHFDVIEFLKNIGALTDGDDNKKCAKKVENFRNSVIDRYKVSVTRRKNGDNFLTAGERKEVKNNPIDLILALISAMVESGAVEYSAGGLKIVDFNK